ncbi:MAG: metalloregulator ArsR/SmtB family transcription factor [Anaerolineaceae bacterium]|nr:metalloregulator ArsR/SmtB family transcription factor [Anaerolineaceae bacterium]
MSMSSNTFTNENQLDQAAAYPADSLRLLDGVCDPVRMEIILLLAKDSPMNVGDIAGKFRISRPAISHHLKVLKDAGIVLSEKSGQEIYYRLDRVRIVIGLRLIADTIENCCRTEPVP